ncbi:peptidase S15 [Elizabethkingia miricola]|uniref:Xaa-Pro dipeptidyl-peptidase C-terminal domain-containing protein n=1 Tax=Elizabethkingia miricola TaxID=172045 RepID=A0ABY3NH18_ELIMR|nr:CocE/NonD family hydrolase [Elizabethkingia miricola]OBS12615.1 peptidase S15 [Elizabethkingia miricola]TYO91896.1 hypothetical protein LX74_02146 [Elizabethkingia miricola]
MRTIQRILLFIFFFILFKAYCFDLRQSQDIIKTDSDSLYSIQDNVMITTKDGGSISAIVVKRKNVTKPLPVILQYTIYVRDKGRDLESLKEAADRGYIGVVAYTRGKRYSPNKIYPYETDAKDAYEIIDWISKQLWCNGSVGMYGGSYNGFTQWAACKNLHPALKTIVPYVANRPGMGHPMENNIFINPNYEWAFYVGNNKFLDNEVNNDRKRFRKMMFDWWYSGAAYNKMDSIDGAPNKWFQRWIMHPDFDQYWQDMAPFQKEFAKINIPVLAFDGYYNDSQNSSLYYLRELQKYNPKTPYYLVIGPYGHFGTQRGGEPVINDYKVDEVALFDIKKITYEWFDYILKSGKKPEFLKDRITYEVMGSNEWRGASGLDKMYNGFLKFYLSDLKKDSFYSLVTKKPSDKRYLEQTVDFRDRENSNNDYYPSPIVRKEIDASNGFVFISQPMDKAILINGSFLGQLKLSINKRDADIGVTLYELTPNGEYFHLSYYIGRASYAKDITKRNLLKPGEATVIDFSNTHLISKHLDKGSRLVVAVNVNKNPFSQLNYGTGKDVSTETMKDAGEPLLIKWYTDSYVKIPVLK